VYPEVGLKKVCDRCDERAKLVVDGIDPKRRAQTAKTHGMSFSDPTQTALLSPARLAHFVASSSASLLSSDLNWSYNTRRTRLRKLRRSVTGYAERAADTVSAERTTSGHLKGLCVGFVSFDFDHHNVVPGQMARH
jgi:hypothetical protein